MANVDYVEFAALDPANVIEEILFDEIPMEDDSLILVRFERIKNILSEFITNNEDDEDVSVVNAFLKKIEKYGDDEYLGF